MEYLLDTHTVLWLLSDQRKLSRKAKLILEDTDNICHVSIASIWEISIKLSLGKLDLKIPITDLEETLFDNEVNLLPIEVKHINRVSRLKFHHRDPFDRLIIAQAIEEKYSVISMDPHFEKYKVKVIW